MNLCHTLLACLLLSCFRLVSAEASSEAAPDDIAVVLIDAPFIIWILCVMPGLLFRAFSRDPNAKSHGFPYLIVAFSAMIVLTSFSLTIATVLKASSPLELASNFFLRFRPIPLCCAILQVFHWRSRDVATVHSSESSTPRVIIELGYRLLVAMFGSVLALTALEISAVQGVGLFHTLAIVNYSLFVALSGLVVFASGCVVQEIRGAECTGLSGAPCKVEKAEQTIEAQRSIVGLVVAAVLMRGLYLLLLSVMDWKWGVPTILRVTFLDVVESGILMWLCQPEQRLGVEYWYYR